MYGEGASLLLFRDFAFGVGKTRGRCILLCYEVVEGVLSGALHTYVCIYVCVARPFIVTNPHKRDVSLWNCFSERARSPLGNLFFFFFL